MTTTPISAETAVQPWVNADASWLIQRRVGLMLHYLGPTPQSPAEEAACIARWNHRVDAFDVGRLVNTLKQTDVGYLFFTVGQNSGCYCSPNATYDRISRITPSRLSRRDLIADLADACVAADLPLIVYSTFSAPADHAPAIERLGFVAGATAGDSSKVFLRHTPGHALTDAQRNWEAVHREWSLRWGRRVSGWWIDGAAFSDGKVIFADEPDYRSLALALKAGNPQSIVAFNPGVYIPLWSKTPCDDYTAGETNALPTHNSHHPIGRDYPGPKYHILSYLGEFWGTGVPRYPDDLLIAYTRYLVSRGGAITWDVPIDPAGRIPDPFLVQLKRIGRAVRS